MYSLDERDEETEEEPMERLNVMRAVQDFRGISQGERCTPLESGNVHSSCERKIETLINTLNELQGRNTDLRRRLNESYDNYDPLGRQNRMAREHAGEITTDLNELCEGITDGR